MTSLGQHIKYHLTTFCSSVLLGIQFNFVADQGEDILLFWEKCGGGDLFFVFPFSEYITIEN